MAEDELKSVATDEISQDISAVSADERDKDETTDAQDDDKKEEEQSNIFNESAKEETRTIQLDMPEIEEETDDEDDETTEEGEDKAEEKTVEVEEEKEEPESAEGTKEAEADADEAQPQLETSEGATKEPEKLEESTPRAQDVATETPTAARESSAAFEGDMFPKVSIIGEADADAVSIITTVTITDTAAATTSTKKKRKVSGRRTIYYDFKPRFRDDEVDIRKPSGDFGLLEEEVDAPTKFYGYMGEDQKEEEEEFEEEVEEEEIVYIDREPYYQRHIELTEEINAHKVKNNIIQKKLAVFFKRRKMEHVLKEYDQQYDTQHKYGKKLDMYEELIQIDQAQRESTTKEVEVLKVKRDSKYAELTKLFKDMLTRETETGNGLIYTKTGNTIPDKLVEKLVHRQQVQMEQVCRMRLEFIQLKDMVAEKQDDIAALDNIGEGLHLMDFEQLKVENRSYADKIEERDEELTRLRFKCQNTIQILAHIREKSSALESDIDDLKDDTAMVDRNFLEAREQLNGIKQERDNYRLQIYKLRNDSGLLTEPALLRDMEASMEELKLTSNELEQLKEENSIKAQQIRNIRRNIEFGVEGFMKKSYRNLSIKPKMDAQIYKGRPSMFMPTLPVDAFNYLKDFRPKVRIIKTKK